MTTELTTKLIKKLILETNNKRIVWSGEVIAGGIARYKCILSGFDVIVCTTTSSILADIYLSKGNTIVRVFSFQDNLNFHAELRTLVLQLITAIKLYHNQSCDWIAIVEDYLK